MRYIVNEKNIVGIVKDTGINFDEVFDALKSAVDFDEILVIDVNPQDHHRKSGVPFAYKSIDRRFWDFHKSIRDFIMDDDQAWEVV